MSVLERVTWYHVSPGVVSPGVVLSGATVYMLNCRRCQVRRDDNVTVNVTCHSRVIG